MKVTVAHLSDERARELTAENRYGAVWEPGLHIIIDGESSILKSRAEAESLISEISAAADALWPPGSHSP